MTIQGAIQLIDKLKPIVNEIKSIDRSDLRQALYTYTDEQFAKAGVNQKVYTKEESDARNEAIRNDETLRILTTIVFGFSDDNRLAVVQYNQTKQNLFELSKYARGLVFDVNTFEIASLPFDQFYNVGHQDNQREIDELIKTYGAYLAVKVDGSLFNLSTHNKELVASTKGSLSRKISVNEKYGVSRNHLMESMKHIDENYEKMIASYPHMTIITESVVSNDERVIKYDDKDFGLHLIGMRDKVTGELFTQSELLDVADHFGVRMGQLVQVGSLAEAQEVVEGPLFAGTEGAVIYVGNQMFKLKRSSYTVAHKLNTITYNNLFTLQSVNAVSQLVKIAVDGDFDDYIVQVARDSDTVTEAFEVINAVVEEELAFAELHLENTAEMSAKEKGAYMKENVDNSKRGAMSGVIFKGGEAADFVLARTKDITKIAMGRIKENRDSMKDK